MLTFKKFLMKQALEEGAKSLGIDLPKALNRFNRKKEEYNADPTVAALNNIRGVAVGFASKVLKEPPPAGVLPFRKPKKPNQANNTNQANKQALPVQPRGETIETK